MRLRTWLAAAAATALLAACGGGGEPFRYEKTVVFGDSLSDVGTYRVGTIAALGGGRWTINDAPNSDLWVDRVASSLGMSKTCAAETGLLPNLAPPFVGAPVTAVSGCFNYAQGSARITSPLGPQSVASQTVLGETNPGFMAKPIQQQIARHQAVSPSGRFSPRDLVIVLAGANDVFMELGLIGTPAGAATPAGAIVNMTTHGTALANLIRNEVVGKGAQRVLVVNVPYVAGTPFAQAADVSAPGTAALIDSLVRAFNTALAAGLNGVPNVRLGDAYSVSEDQFNRPGVYGIVNNTAVACGANLFGSPAGSALICNTGNLAVSASDAQGYQYADSVHPTPYGHRLLADFALQQLSIAGWR